MARPREAAGKETIVIGVDCATDPRKVGVALGRVTGARLTLLKTATGQAGQSVAAQLASWVGAGDRVLFALDSPLGWPAPLGKALARHKAGAPLKGMPNELFRRQTARVIKERIGKLQLDVGADRIARTAHWALNLLEELRRRTGEPIPMAWEPQFRQRLAVIEVYPAGTLRARGMTATDYKRPEKKQVRRRMLAGLAKEMDLPSDTASMLEDADVLDAAVCTLAAMDFLAGRAIPPSDMSLAEKEGWVWVYDPGA